MRNLFFDGKRTDARLMADTRGLQKAFGHTGIKGFLDNYESTYKSPKLVSK